MMKLYAMAGLVAVLCACAQPQKPMTAEEAAYDRYLSELIAKRDAERVPTTNVSLGCAGHGKVGYIHSYAVQEPVYGQISRGMVSGLSCGGIAAGGYTLPVKWTRGMKVKVRWKPDGREWVEKTTTILPYDKIGNLYVHFFSNDEVRVVVSPVGTLNPAHPILKGTTVPPPEPD